MPASSHASLKTQIRPTWRNHDINALMAIYFVALYFLWYRVLPICELFLVVILLLYKIWYLSNSFSPLRDMIQGN